MVKFQRKFNQLVNAILLVGIAVLLISSAIRTSVASTLQSWLLQTGFLNAETPASLSLGRIGKPLALAHLDGTPLDTALLAKKTIFLHVWASWCPPCIAELPDIQQLVEAVSPEEVAFLLISVDKDEDKLTEFLTDHGYTFPVYRLLGELPDGIQYNAIPTTYIIAPSGEILYKHEGLAQYNHDEFRRFLLEAH